MQRVTLIAVTIGLSLAACASDDYRLTEIPNYDHLVGKKYIEVIPYAAQLGFKKTLDAPDHEEVEDKRPDGCSTIFGIRKADGVITYWRVLPSPNACKVARKALNV
jgi:hypothetical protein